MKIIILGATGMLGYSLFTNLSECESLDIYGTVRSIKGKEKYFNQYFSKIIKNIDIYNIDNIKYIIDKISPDIIINCIGLIKQHDISKQHISAIQINSLLPHQLANLCTQNNIRLIHFSTDCVFDGTKGNYHEHDLPTATDLYGKSKCLGEVHYGQHLTLRTSIIGHELNSTVSLVDWFLNQQNSVSGFSKAIFSGLPTCFIAKILFDHILYNDDLKGLYHLSVEPIDKFNLINEISRVYKKDIIINKDTKFNIDRSLNSDKFRTLTNFTPPTWADLINDMYKDYQKRYTI